jgi:Na+-transporting NADH:ubiquinone oxidoreductase subunit NqrB
MGWLRGKPSQLCADARHLQIAALGTLLVINMAWLDFGARPLGAAAAIAGTLAGQALCSRLSGNSRPELRSALITGLSLSLLLRCNEPALYLLAGALAMSSKFLLRIDGKHIWNPATFAIVALRYGTDAAWISPGQWGAALWFAALLLLLATMVLRSARRADSALFFLAVHLALLMLRAWRLGDPLAIPLHQMESGSLLIFAFFMVTDPRATPDRRSARLLFVASVALLGHVLAFQEQMREALYLALFLLAPLVPVLDCVLPAARFAWRPAPPVAALTGDRG